MTVRIRKAWLPENLYPMKAPYALVPKGIVVHNTAGTASAIEERDIMVRNSNSPVGFHVVIDENEAVEVVPFRRNTWHAGDGGLGYGNRNLIGIEIARSKSPNQIYLKAEDNAAEYIAGVLFEYGWGVDKLHKHKEFTATACPHKTEELGWGRFISKVSSKLTNLQSKGFNKELKDTNKPSNWATGIWKQATDIKLVDGSNPKKPATREEVVAMILKNNEIN